MFEFLVAPSFMMATVSMAEVNFNTVDDDIEVIEIKGRNVENIGKVTAGSSGLVGYDDLKNRPISRVGEILEVIPGLVATQHSGTGKANQFFLRGFNLDHGTDFATFVDGAPINMRTHGHGQGYTDLNFIIPELVERVEFKKGPYHTDVGDFGSAGSSSISTYNRLDKNIASVTFGENGFARGLVAASFDIAEDVHLLTAIEGNLYDSPFEREEDLEKLNAFAKLSGTSDDLRWNVGFNYYDASWNATDQVANRAVESGLIGRLGTLDEDLGGNTERFAITANVATEDTSFSAYYVNYSFNLFSNFTYFLNDSVRGDEFEQFDDRSIFGGNIQRHWHLDAPVPVKFTVGADIRHDDIGAVGLYGTEGRVRHTLIRDDEVSSTSYAGFAKAQFELAENVRFETGARLDHIAVDVNATINENSGTETDTIVSPSASLAWRVAPEIELYANYGEGFHSNDARGGTINVDPVTGDAVDAVPLYVKSRGAEIGARYETERFKAALVGFWLNLDSELVFVGDAGTTEVNDGTRRFGVEASVFWQAADWLNMHASYAYTRARFRGGVAEDRIPNAVPSVFSAGVDIDPADNISTSFILRHFGGAPLIEDGSVKSESTTTVNWGGYYSFSNFKLGVEVLNLFDSKDPDISYFFESRLPGEAAGVEDLHTHPLEPRQLRVTLQATF
ncbi:TonB-dependent receptor [Kordiimonas laminariae]|uniref:TonB-dependent receptor n=1 Tax=Kordiimonas laminariae TaxID=2917717 RepID=UPI001FF38A44|nr:TonB-dependent receptor [Kordiimonas laminariae]MCK0070628.1 TonB-dependent receptor [Kordiimonas laminariae]